MKKSDQTLGRNELSTIEHVLFHPSQDLTPSREDLEVTKHLGKCGKILGIEVLDHLIVNAAAEFISLKEKGYL